jgi:hypothetical protein
MLSARIRHEGFNGNQVEFHRRARSISPIRATTVLTLRSHARSSSCSKVPLFDILRAQAFFAVDFRRSNHCLAASSMASHAVARRPRQHA